MSAVVVVTVAKPHSYFDLAPAAAMPFADVAEFADWLATRHPEAVSADGGFVWVAIPTSTVEVATDIAKLMDYADCRRAVEDWSDLRRAWIDLPWG